MSLPASLCLYCGSKPGKDPAFMEAAQALGRFAAQTGIRLVYGGGRVGLMGAAADACLESGGEVVGIIPDFLMRHEVGHRDLTRLEVVGSMHERKTRMAELAEAFCILPGGLGTLEELFEVLTWRQLGLHNKPIVVLDIQGYWQPLSHLLQAQLAGGFLREVDLELLRFVPGVEELAEALHARPAVQTDITGKWA